MDLRNLPGSRLYAILVTSAVALVGPNALSADVTKGLQRLRYDHPGLVVGAEDGFLYYLKNPHAKATKPNGNAGQDE